MNFFFFFNLQSLNFKHDSSVNSGRDSEIMSQLLFFLIEFG